MPDAVDRLIDERGGKELLTPTYDDAAVPIRPFLHRSTGFSASYLLSTSDGRIVVNTGLGFEAPHHKALFDAVDPSPTRFIITTQAHTDHVGGVAWFREPETVYVAQRDNPAFQHADARVFPLRVGLSRIWFPLRKQVLELATAHGATSPQDAPTPDLLFDDRLSLTVGELDLELISAPGGETTDSIVIWLPQHGIAMVGNLFGPLYPHFPNLNTLRGDSYRYVEPYLAAIETVRGLGAELMLTGRGAPIEGNELIDASLARLSGAVDHVHTEALRRFNDGEDVLSVMREVQLPPELRVGEGYGKVAWAVRTIWESYIGWFRQQSTTELYPVDHREAAADLVELAGVDVVLGRARTRIAEGQPVHALHLAEAVLVTEPDHAGAIGVMVDAHQALIDHVGDENFWESGWLHHQLDEWKARLPR